MFMKKCLAFLFVFLILLPFCSCAERTYELSWDGFCYVPGEPYEQPLELDPKDKNDIIDILNSATWYGDLAKCPADFIFVTHAKPRILGYGLIALPEDCVLEFDSALFAEIEEFDPVGMNSQQAWGSDKLFRIHLKVTGKEGDFTFRIYKS